MSTLKQDHYIANAVTVQGHFSNVSFQLDNVEGWLKAKELDLALIKAECALEALQKLIAQLKEETK